MAIEMLLIPTGGGSWWSIDGVLFPVDVSASSLNILGTSL